jgi:hypothetical protein
MALALKTKSSANNLEVVQKVPNVLNTVRNAPSQIETNQLVAKPQFKLNVY